MSQTSLKVLPFMVIITARDPSKLPTEIGMEPPGKLPGKNPLGRNP
jgi:hypothetical protein